MRITFRIVLKPDASAAVARDPALAEGIDLTAVAVELDHDDPRFHRLLQVTRHTQGGWFNPYMSFTAAEISAAKFLQLDCRGKILDETSADSDQNRQIVGGCAFHRAGERALPIRLIDRIALTKVAIAPNAVGCATHWMPEFVLPRAIADAFREDGLTGFETRPVMNSKAGQPHADFFLLYSSSIMPEAERDVTTLDQRATDNPAWRELGALSYQFDGGEEPRDFNRTAENWSNHHLPLWIVSQRVREVVTRRKFKGWAYRPVLEKGSPLHAEYLAMWTAAVDRIRENPRNLL